MDDLEKLEKLFPMVEGDVVAIIYNECNNNCKFHLLLRCKVVCGEENKILWLAIK